MAATDAFSNLLGNSRGNGLPGERYVAPQYQFMGGAEDGVLVSLHGLTDPGKKIQAIKEVRWVTKLGLRESKDIVDRVSNGEPLTIRCSLAHGDPVERLTAGYLQVQLDQPEGIRTLSVMIPDEHLFALRKFIAEHGGHIL